MHMKRIVTFALSLVLKARVLEPANGLSPILRLDRKLAVLGRTGGGGGGRILTSFLRNLVIAMRPRNSPMMHFDTAVTQCHV